MTIQPDTLASPQAVFERIAAVETAPPTVPVPTKDDKRYPDTYGADFLRTHADAFGIPRDIAESRGMARQWLRGQLGITANDRAYAAHKRFDDCIVALADAYIREHGGNA